MKFKVGDKIKHKDFGVGEIVYIHEEGDEPYAVQFETFNKYLHSLGYRAPKVKDGHGWWCRECDLKLVEEAPKTLIPQIAKMLGVEIGEVFEIDGKTVSNMVCKFTDLYLLSKDKRDKGEAHWSIAFVPLSCLLSGEWHIKKLFNKPHLTEDEKTILRNLPRKYNWIARDSSGALFVYGNKPKKGSNVWIGDSLGYFNSFKHLFQFINFEDKEPYNIEELLKGE